MPKEMTEKELVLLQYAIRSNRSFYVRSRKVKRNSKKKNARIAAPSTALSILFRSIKNNNDNKKSRGKIQLDIPKNFSLIDNHRESLNAIFAFVKKISKIKQVGKLIINHIQMEKYDLSAESLIDYIISEFDKTTPKKIEIVGFYPKKVEARKFIRGVGIIDELKIEHERLPKQQLETLEVFKGRSRKYQDTKVGVSKTYQDEVCMNFARHISGCLERIGRELTDEAKIKLIQCVSEIIDNVIEHSQANEWSLSGYLDASDEDMRCEISILNFGKTISETFKDLPDNSYPWKHMEKYVELHGKLFKKDDLITVFSLQGDVSSKNIGPECTRGQGTIQLIGFFQTLHNELRDIAQSDKQFAMTVLSGSTLIKFDTDCQLKHDGTRETIAFNKSNQLNEPPEKKYVINTGDLFFPGTIIAMRFHVPKTMTQEALT